MTDTLVYSNPLSLIPADCALLRTAKSSIDMAAYSLTERQIVATLAERAQTGVKVRLYLDHEELASSIREAGGLTSCPIAPLLVQPNIDVRVKESTVLMHLKSYCVDGLMLRDGSANLTDPGEEIQDNSLTTTDDPARIALFAAKFTQMWNRPNNLTAQAVASAVAAKCAGRPHSTRR